MARWDKLSSRRRQCRDRQDYGYFVRPYQRKTDTALAAGIDGADATKATAAITALDTAITSVSTARSNHGAVQNRFDSVIANLQTSSENLTASRSRIMDADFAVETSNLSRSQILQQAGTAMVAQANQLPQGVLALLR
jgi:flagellin